MINVYKINKEKFKSVYISVNFTMNVNEKGISESAVLASLLSKSSKKYKNQIEIEKYMYELFGAEFDVNVQKYGDLYNVEFLIEAINKDFLPGNEDVIIKCVNFLHDIITEPNLENNTFSKDLVEREKKAILEKIKSKKDDKLRYSVTKMEEIMCNGENFGVYVYGTEKVVSQITPEDLYQRYIWMLNNSCITVIISGNLNGYDKIDCEVNRIFNDINSNISYENLNFNNKHEKHNDKALNETIEKSDTTQSVISMGLKVEEASIEEFYILSLYNAILGSTPSSKLFQNFREKESLAYTVRSRYYRFKDIIIIYAGIESENFNKAKKVIEKELNDIVIGNITDEEFNAAKTSVISDFNEWDDSKVALAKMLFVNLIIYKNDQISIEKMINLISNVTKSQVIDIAKKIKLKEIFLLGGSDCE